MCPVFDWSGEVCSREPQSLKILRRGSKTTPDARETQKEELKTCTNIALIKDMQLVGMRIAQ